jgi:WD40 repeat protein
MSLDAVSIASTGGEFKEFKLKQSYGSSETSYKMTGNYNIVTALEYHPDPQTRLKLSGSADGTVKVWHYSNSAIPKSIISPPTNSSSTKPEITAAAWSPTGEFIAYSIGNIWNQGIYSLQNPPYVARTFIHRFRS